MFDQLRGVFASLNSHEVEYLVIGGVAAIAHGSTRNTFDLDLLIHPTVENASRLLEALLAVQFGTAALITAEELIRNEITIFRDRVNIDVQTSTPGLVWPDAWARRVVMQAHGVQIVVLSKEDLIASKRATGRPKDLADIRELSESGESADTG